MLINNTIATDAYGSAIRMSCINKFEDAVSFCGFSAKYVLSGQELYIINNKKYTLGKGDYIIGNDATVSSIKIDGMAPAKGVCIDIAPQLIKEVIDFNFGNNYGFDEFLLTDELFIRKYNSQNSGLGLALLNVANQYDTLINSSAILEENVFLTMAECVVADQKKIFSSYYNLHQQKQQTIRRLLEQLMLAKEFIDDCYTEKISIENMALEACLSKYHFIRLFKKAFGITPYRYIMERRLHHGRQLLLRKKQINEVAYSTGFADVASFTKAFKLFFNTF